MIKPVGVAPRVGAWIETIMDYKNDIQDKSHPVWVRGLKQSYCNIGHHEHVAPRVGAWIETNSGTYSAIFAFVAPRVGAWIETSKRGSRYGCKHVAPRMGAWIETPLSTKCNVMAKSHPVWVRGLKPFYCQQPHRDQKSHPVWVRGLKPRQGP